MFRIQRLKSKVLQLFAAKRKRQLVIAIVGLGLATVSLVNTIDWFNTTQIPDAPVQSVLAETVTTTAEEPDETPVKEVVYEVPAEMPRRIILKSIEAEGYIQQVGRDQHGAVAAPSNVHVAGWFNASSLPGLSGVSLIDGHLRGKYIDGIFRRLEQVQPKEVFEIEFGDRTVKQFEVVSVDTYTAALAAEEQFRKLDGINEQLTLITCGGTYDRATKQYQDRTIVRSKLLR